VIEEANTILMDMDPETVPESIKNVIPAAVADNPRALSELLRSLPTASDDVAKAVLEMCDSVAETHPDLYFESKRVLKAIAKAAESNPSTFCQPLLEAAGISLKGLLNGLGKGTVPEGIKEALGIVGLDVPEDIKKALLSLSDVAASDKDLAGLLRTESLEKKSSPVKEAIFSSLFGFENLPKVKEYAATMEQFVPWSKFPIVNGQRRSDVLQSHRAPTPMMQ
jgi:hypothetical protein